MLKLGAGHICFHVLCGDASDLIVGENVNKAFRLVFDVVLALSASASDPGCHAVSVVLFSVLFEYLPQRTVFRFHAFHPEARLLSRC
jgi:hypothetical protein